MPTLRQNISYGVFDFKRRYGASVLHVAKRIAVLVLVALMLETFVFNINYFAPRAITPRTSTTA